MPKTLEVIDMAQATLRWEGRGNHVRLVIETPDGEGVALEFLNAGMSREGVEGFVRSWYERFFPKGFPGK